MSDALPFRHRLAARAAARFAGGVVILAGMLFLSAGTWRWWQAWVYLVALFTPILLVLLWLLSRDPALLELRMRDEERQRGQNAVQMLGAVAYLLVYVIAGLDHRFGWSSIHTAVVIAGDVILLLSYALFADVLRTNSYASRVLEIQPGQRVISSGPYRLVRHPMYLAALGMFAATPVALGSWWGVPLVLPEVAVLVARIRSEERMLAGELAGYVEYAGQVRWRLMPGVW